MKKRICAVILLLISILFWPLWLSVMLAVIGMIYFHYFAEAVVLFFLSDLLYGVNEVQYWGLVCMSAILLTILLMSTEFLKRKLKFYPKL